MLTKLKEQFARKAQPVEATEQLQLSQPSESSQNRDRELFAERLERIENKTVETLTNVTGHSLQIKDQLARIEQKLAEFVATVTGTDDQERLAFTPAEFAQKAIKEGKRRHLSPLTVRRWCLEERIQAKKRPGRGDGEWEITREEYNRWASHNLLPPKD